MKSTIGLVAATIALSVSPAHAYIDPGTGSLILQAVLAGFAGAALVLRMYWRKIKALFGARQPEKTPRDEA